MSDLPQLLKRLENATIRLEELAAKGGAGSAAGSKSAPAAGHADSSAASSPSLDAFDEIVSGPFQLLADSAAKVGGLVNDQVLLVKKAIEAQRHLLTIAAKSKKPDQATFQQLLQPTSDLLSKIVEIREKNRTSPLFNHLSAISEGVPALGWVAVEPKPAPFVGEMKDAAQFYSNRILKDFKEKDKFHAEFVAGFTNTLVELQNFVKKFHTTGLVWAANGGDAKSFVGAAAPVTAAAPAQAAAAPAAAKPAVAPGAGLFSELNKGGDITSGLKKVEKSQMTHKNPNLRASSVVKAEDSAPGIASKASTGAPKGPAKLALEGNRWCVENQDNNKNIVIDNADLKHAVYIFNCSNCTIQIKSKVNTVILDNCKKTAVVVASVVASVELVNCKSVQAQILGKAPTANIEKTDGCILYLSRECLDIEIFSSKSSEMNVSIPGPTDKDDFIEKAIAEQFKTTVVGQGLHTATVEHKG